MGEIAEAMLDGTFCACCGEVFDDMLDDDAEPPGHPRLCATCGGDDARFDDEG